MGHFGSFGSYTGYRIPYMPLRLHCQFLSRVQWGPVGGDIDRERRACVYIGAVVDRPRDPALRYNVPSGGSSSSSSSSRSSSSSSSRSSSTSTTTWFKMVDLQQTPAMAPSRLYRSCIV